MYPVNLTFDGCSIKVANTTKLVSLDYSAGGSYGCVGNNMHEGDLLIKNSVFTDTMGGSLTFAGISRSLFNVKSLYDVKLWNVTFSNMGLKHGSVFSDYVCQQ